MDCDQCSGLEDAWMDVAILFTEVPEVEPAPGFVNRWQATLEADQAAVKTMRQRWQSLIFLVLVANGAALALVLMGVQLFNTYGSVTDWVMSWVYKAATAMVLANGFRNAFVTTLSYRSSIDPNRMVDCYRNYVGRFYSCLDRINDEIIFSSTEDIMKKYAKYAVLFHHHSDCVLAITRLCKRTL